MQAYLRALPIAALLAFAAIHLGILWVYNSPDNWIKLQHDRALKAYVDPLFYQDWAFFAPEPIDRDIEAYARVIDDHGRETPWLNVEAAMIASLQQDRLSSKEFLLAGLSGGALFVANSPQLTKTTKSQTYQLSSIRSMYRTSASIIQTEIKNRRFVKIQVGIITTVFPRFSRRYDTRNESGTLQQLPWMPFPIVENFPW